MPSTFICNRDEHQHSIQSPRLGHAALLFERMIEQIAALIYP